MRFLKIIPQLINITNLKEKNIMHGKPNVIHLTLGIQESFKINCNTLTH